MQISNSGNQPSGPDEGHYANSFLHNQGGFLNPSMMPPSQVSAKLSLPIENNIGMCGHR